MPDHADMPAEQAVTTDLGAAGDPGAAGDGAMCADVAVMRDLHQVIHAHVLFQHGVFQCAAVDAGVGADLAVVADHHAAQLRDLDPVTGIHRQAEAVGTDHRTGMDAHALAQTHPGDQGDAGEQLAAVIDHAVLADDAAGADHAAIAHAAARTDADERADVCVWRNLCAGVDHRGRVDPRFAHRRHIEQGRDLGERCIGILGHQRGAACIRRIVGAQDHHGRLALAQLWPVARIGQEAQLPGAGMRQGGDATDFDGAIADDGQPKLFGNCTGGQAHQGEPLVNVGAPL